MSSPRPGAVGATRSCPHCKVTILESAQVCPACRGHLRFDAPAEGSAKLVPLQVEGSLSGTRDSAFEYTVVVVVRDERGKEISRHVAGVGAVFPGENREFVVTVEAVPAPPDRRRVRH
ncbi:MAG: hypothetical protein IT472_10710 [Thermomonas sp.]|uniref:hypothetical protein n=1 Tax=Thermomonas sp. TaxID=1971895 RepID=UPI00263534EA|nr:hypothetical protein [Thermomonas sp.]MCC7097639.1 hypothetical protein [Thermomonas sp.]